MRKSQIVVMWILMIIGFVMIGTGCSTSKTSMYTKDSKIEGESVSEKLEDTLYNDEGEAVLSTASSNTTKGAAEGDEEKKSETIYKPHLADSAHSSNGSNIANGSQGVNSSYSSNNSFDNNDEHPANDSNRRNEMNDGNESHGLHISNEAFNADSSWAANEKNNNYDSYEANEPHEYQTATPKNQE